MMLNTPVLRLQSHVHGFREKGIFLVLHRSPPHLSSYNCAKALTKYVSKPQLHSYSSKGQPWIEKKIKLNNLFEWNIDSSWERCSEGEIVSAFSPPVVNQSVASLIKGNSGHEIHCEYQ